MGHFASSEGLHAMEAELDTQRPVPNKDPEQTRVVYWHVFRRREDVPAFARWIMLEPGEELVAGHCEDDLGRLWWLGVRVDDLEKWGNRRAVHKIDAGDGQNPGSTML